MDPKIRTNRIAPTDEEEQFKALSTDFWDARQNLQAYKATNGDDETERYNVLYERMKDASNWMIHAEQRWKDAVAAAAAATTPSTEKKVAEESDGSPPPQKKTRYMIPEIAFQGPVPNNYYDVPMESIEEYQRLSSLFSNSSVYDLSRPLALLYGPRLFGKTTIAHRLGQEISRDLSVRFVYLRLSEDIVESETSFWNAIGRHAGHPDFNNVEKESDLTEILSRHKQRLCIFIDDFDVMFKNEVLAAKVLVVLSRWKTAPFFYGFLGIGNYDLINLHKRHQATSPFDLTNVLAAKRFSVEQMNDFFARIELSYNFTANVRREIIDYSSGVPGVFGSLIRFTIDHNKWKCQLSEWYSWFKFQQFDNYLSSHNYTYVQIQNNIKCLDKAYSDALVYLLRYRKVEQPYPTDLSFDKLLSMGVGIMNSQNDEITLSSEMMYRICMEAQPVRRIGY